MRMATEGDAFLSGLEDDYVSHCKIQCSLHAKSEVSCACYSEEGDRCMGP